MKEDHNTERDYLKDLAPNLFDRKIDVDEHPPEGYFDTLGDRVMNRIDAENAQKDALGQRKVVKLINWKNIAVAAAIAAVIATVQIVYLSEQSDDAIVAEESTTPLGENFETTDMENYLSDEDIYNAFASSDISAGAILNDELENDVIIDYLLQEDLSEEIIIEEIES